MALDVLEKYQVEYLVEQLKKVYPNELSDLVIEQLKDKLTRSDKDLSLLTNEIYELNNGDKTKLQSFLVQYQVDINPKKEEVKTVLFQEVNYDNNVTSNLLSRNGQYVGDDFVQSSQMEELESIVQMTTNMNDQEIAVYLRSLGKNPQQIMMIMLSLEDRKQQLENQQENHLEKAKQKVLIKQNPKGRMAGFIDALTLAFFVGAASGMAFLILISLLLEAVS